MKIGDEVFVHGYVDEIRKDCIIIRNDGGYFGTGEDAIISVEIKGLYQDYREPSVTIEDTPQPDEIGDCNICRFAGCSECDDCINGSEWVRMVDYLEDVDDEQTDCLWK